MYHPPLMCEGDLYSNPGDNVALPTNLTGAVAAYQGSELAARLGEDFSTVYLCIANHEVALAAEHSPDPDDVTDWERDRFAEHS